MPLTTSLDIINAACALIGEDALQSFDGEAGQAAHSIYEAAVNFNLGIYPFSFGKELHQLARVTGATPLSGFTNVFDLPPDRLGPPIYVTDDATDPGRRFARFALVGDVVHCDADPLFAMIKILPAPHRWSATFRSCTITACAAQLAFSLASDRQTLETMNSLAYGSPIENFRGGQMRAAINEDAQATPPRRADWGNNPLTNSWRG